MTRQSGSRHVWSGDGAETRAVRGHRVSTGSAAFPAKLKKGKVSKVDQPGRARVIPPVRSGTDPALSAGTGGSLLDLYGALSNRVAGPSATLEDIDDAIAETVAEENRPDYLDQDS